MHTTLDLIITAAVCLTVGGCLGFLIAAILAVGGGRDD